MTDDWHTELLLRPVFIISLGPLQRLIALRAVSLPVILAIMIQTTNNGTQGVGIQLKTLQTLLSLTADFPIIHGRLLENVRAFILCFLFASLPTGMRRKACFKVHSVGDTAPIGHDRHRQRRRGSSPRAAHQ